MATLSIARQREIEGVITNLFQEKSLSYPGTPLLDIAAALGAEVYFGDLPESETEGVEGVIEWLESGKARIIINDSFSKERSTFTLAHELGHMILHPNKTKNRVDIYNYSEPESIDETEANFFAASLLMPKDKFISLWELTRDIGIVSEFFGVSQLAAKNRLSWIGTNTRA